LLISIFDLKTLNLSKNIKNKLILNKKIQIFKKTADSSVVRQILSHEQITKLITPNQPSQLKILVDSMEEKAGMSTIIKDIES
jgi:hypothetical protein